MGINSKTTGRRRIFDLMIIGFIMGLAAFLRLRHLDTTGIWGDQSFTLNLAMNWVNGGDMPLAANKSSVGFVNPPMIEYLYALALRIWPDVLSVAYLTMLSGMIAIGAAGWAAWRLFGRWAALWTMVIFTVNPWSVYYSQLIWNQTMLPVFSSLTLAFLLIYFAVDQRARYLILSFVAAACMTQVHPGASIQLAAMVIIFIIFRHKLKPWSLVVGVTLFIGLYIPFLMYQIGVGWSDFREALDLAQQPATTSMASLLLSLDLLQAKGLLGGVKNTAVFDTFATVLIAYSLTFAAGTLIRSYKQRPLSKEQSRWRSGLVILSVWFIFPILFYIRSPYYLQIYYLLSQIPAHFLLIGFALVGSQQKLEQMMSTWSENGQRIGLFAVRWLLPLPLVILTIWQFGFNLQFQNSRLDKNNEQIRHVRETIQTVNQILAENPACRLVAVSEGHQLEVSRLSFLRAFTSDERIVLTDGRLAVPIPEPCALYLDALHGSRASNWLAANARRMPDKNIVLGEETWEFYEIDSAARDQLQLQFAGSAHLPAWAAGVTLTHFEVGQLTRGESLLLHLVWKVDDTPVKKTFHFGSYLLNPENQVMTQFDGPGYDSVQWQQGDIFLTWFEMPIPPDLRPGDYQIGLAIYTWPELERMNLKSGENTAYLEKLTYPGP